MYLSSLLPFFIPLSPSLSCVFFFFFFCFFIFPSFRFLLLFFLLIFFSCFLFFSFVFFLPSLHLRFHFFSFFSSFIYFFSSAHSLFSFPHLSPFSFFVFFSSFKFLLNFATTTILVTVDIFERSNNEISCSPKFFLHQVKARNGIPEMLKMLLEPRLKHQFCISQNGANPPRKRTALCFQSTTILILATVDLFETQRFEQVPQMTTILRRATIPASPEIVPILGARTL